ncbi:MAG: hypothetical protein RLZZ414_1168, partial [Bacteroidota bacterium]|jgi:hypothetical protein
MFKKLILLISILFVGYNIHANSIEFQNKIKNINALQQKMINASIMELMEVNNQMIDSLRILLSNPDFENYSLDSLKNFYILNGPKNEFRIITWKLQENKDKFMYFGFTQYFLGKNKIKVCLLDENNNWEQGQFTTQDTSKWLGCVYYSMVPPKKYNDDYYILFGWDGNGSKTKKKIIEVVKFNKQGIPTFGKDIFVSEEFKAPRGKKIFRIVMEYASNVSITLHYDLNMNMIVFDHLSPTNERLKGVRAAYVPDFSFDAFKYEKGKWNHLSDVDARVLKTPKPQKFNPRDYPNNE